MVKVYGDYTDYMSKSEIYGGHAEIAVNVIFVI
jgi:hypothetical protein